jgi:hypothetical protein
MPWLLLVVHVHYARSRWWQGATNVRPCSIPYNLDGDRRHRAAPARARLPRKGRAARCDVSRLGSPYRCGSRRAGDPPSPLLVEIAAVGPSRPRFHKALAGTVGLGTLLNKRARSASTVAPQPTLHALTTRSSHAASTLLARSSHSIRRTPMICCHQRTSTTRRGCDEPPL